MIGPPRGSGPCGVKRGYDLGCSTVYRQVNRASHPAAPAASLTLCSGKVLPLFMLITDAMTSELIRAARRIQGFRRSNLRPSLPPPP